MGIYRWYAATILSVFLALPSYAAVTVAVPRASVETLLKNASPVLNENPLGYTQAYDSSFQYKQLPYSNPVSQKVSIPSAAVKEAVKGALKQQAAVAVASAAISAAVAAAGWVIDEAGQPVKKIPGGVASNDGSGQTYYWSTGYDNKKYATMDHACNAYMTSRGGDSTVISQKTEESAFCLVKDGSNSIASTYINRLGSSCPPNTSYNTDDGGCYAPSTTALVDADYDTLTSVIDNQDSPTKAAIADAACKASTSPSRCYQALQDAASFLNSGSTSIKGPSSSSVTTNKASDGTTTNTTTNNQTNFTINYNSSGYTATPKTTTTTTNSDGSVSTTESTEDSNASGSSTEESEDDPLDKTYTFTDPELPEVPSFYEQKYPDGLKSVWDSNKSNFDNSKFISFMKSFVPSFSGSCPTWGLPMNIMAQASYGYVNFTNICYVFDFVKIVIIATAVFTARKIMFGG